VKRYGVAEVFSTLQGEGYNTGSPAVFLRFAGCNLGYDVCPWCDTDWVKAAYVLPLPDLVELVSRTAASEFGKQTRGLLLVLTGGEPSLQHDVDLADALRRRGFRLAMETNGSRRIERDLVDWLTVSPKQTSYAQKEGNELKVVFTGSSAPGIAPTVQAVRDLAQGTRFEHYFLQPVDLGASGGSNYAETVDAVLRLGPPWRLSLQAHKVLSIR
jgi:7-carboxy-7-deazaguanine synthase